MYCRNYKNIKFTHVPSHTGKKDRDILVMTMLIDWLISQLVLALKKEIQKKIKFI